MMLRCSGCECEKPIERFSLNKAMKSGRANWCKDCHQQYYTSPRYLEARKKRRDNAFEHSLFIEIRHRAKKRNIPFDLQESDIVIPDVCPVLGIKLARSRAGLSDATPTVDRIVGTIGYVRGNVAVISWKANRIKTNCDDPGVFESIARYIRASIRNA